jgi:hypothetical protein
MGAQIPLVAEKPLAVSGCRKFKIDTLGDHLYTCTAHSGAKKTHDWVVGQLPEFFHTTHTAKIQQVVRSRGQYCGDVDLVEYLANASGDVPLVLDLLIVHDRFGSRSDPTFNGTLHYPNPNDIDKSLNEAPADKIRKYHSLLFLQTHRESDRFFADSGVQST